MGIRPGSSSRSTAIFVKGCFTEVIGLLLGQLAVSLFHTFRLLTGWQVPITAGQTIGTQESIGVFTEPGRLAGREAPGSIHYYARSPAGR